MEKDNEKVKFGLNLVKNTENLIYNEIKKLKVRINKEVFTQNEI